MTDDRDPATPATPEVPQMPAVDVGREPSAAARRLLSLSKAGHEYRFSYEAGEERQVLDALAELAQRRIGGPGGGDAAPLDWFDAAVLGHQLGGHLLREAKQMAEKQAA